MCDRLCISRRGLDCRCDVTRYFPINSRSSNGASKKHAPCQDGRAIIRYNDDESKDDDKGKRWSRHIFQPNSVASSFSTASPSPSRLPRPLSPRRTSVAQFPTKWNIDTRNIPREVQRILKNSCLKEKKGEGASEKQRKGERIRRKREEKRTRYRVVCIFRKYNRPA